MIIKCISHLIASVVIGLVAMGAVAVGSTAHAAQPEIHRGFGSNVAVGGHDPVAYFTEGKPVRGQPQFKTIWKGAEWRFATAANLAAFQANPARYAPQYGGYCAWAVSQGYTAKGDPQHWKIVGGKLYLNYNADVQSKWEKNIPGFITSADKNWPKVLAK